VVIPPFHPDTPEFRREWARHYENLTAVDYQAGDLLAELARDGLAEDTIVFFFGDNGTGMPGVKMFAWGPSIHVPLLVRIPSRWAAYAPGPPGSALDRLVSFVDFAPTVLSLAGLEIPPHLQGAAFLGPRAAPPSSLVFGGKDRQGECADTIRYVRDARFQYNRNFHPEVPFGQYMSYTWQHASMRAWEQLHREGQLRGPTARFLAPTKPVEELYDLAADPWQVNNLAGDPRHAADLERLRTVLYARMREVGDLGLLPEREMHARALGRTPYDVALDPALNPVEELQRAADLANRRDPRDLARLVQLLQARDSAVRWWGAIGLASLGAQAAPAKAVLRSALQDGAAEVRLAAAEALLAVGEEAIALQTIDRCLRDDSVFVRFSALQVASRLGTRARPLLPSIRQARLDDPRHKDISDYIGRMVEYLPGRLAL
jgi:uncharacterized sulfatase